MEVNGNRKKETVRIAHLTGVTVSGCIVAELTDGSTVGLILMPGDGLAVRQDADAAALAPIFENGVLVGFERSREEEAA